MRPGERLARQRKQDEDKRALGVMRERRATVAALNPLTVTFNPDDAVPTLIGASALVSAVPLTVGDVVTIAEVGNGYPPVVLGKTTTDAS